MCEKKKISRYRLAQKSGIAQFFAGDEEISDLTADQKQLLSDWNAMDEHQKELVKGYIQGIIRK